MVTMMQIASPTRGVLRRTTISVRSWKACLARSTASSAITTGRLSGTSIVPCRARLWRRCSEVRTSGSSPRFVDGMKPGREGVRRSAGPGRSRRAGAFAVRWSGGRSCRCAPGQSVRCGRGSSGPAPGTDDAIGGTPEPACAAHRARQDEHGRTLARHVSGSAHGRNGFWFTSRGQRAGRNPRARRRRRRRTTSISPSLGVRPNIVRDCGKLSHQ